MLAKIDNLIGAGVDLAIDRPLQLLRTLTKFRLGASALITYRLSTCA